MLVSLLIGFRQRTKTWYHEAFLKHHPGLQMVVLVYSSLLPKPPTPPVPPIVRPLGAFSGRSGFRALVQLQRHRPPPGAEGVGSGTVATVRKALILADSKREMVMVTMV